jgi:hypothetical protein
VAAFVKQLQPAGLSFFLRSKKFWAATNTSGLAYES